MYDSKQTVNHFGSNRGTGVYSLLDFVDGENFLLHLDYWLYLSDLVHKVKSSLLQIKSLMSGRSTWLNL